MNHFLKPNPRQSLWHSAGKSFFATWFLKEQQGRAWQRYKHHSSHALPASMANPGLRGCSTSHPSLRQRPNPSLSLKDFVIIPKITSLQLPPWQGCSQGAPNISCVSDHHNFFNPERNPCFQSSDDSGRVGNSCEAQPADPEQVVGLRCLLGSQKCWTLSWLKSKNGITAEFNRRERQTTLSLIFYILALKSWRERTKRLHWTPSNVGILS